MKGAKGIGAYLSCTNISTYIKATILEIVIDKKRDWMGKTKPITR